jgi:hypothetical protein
MKYTLLNSNHTSVIIFGLITLTLALTIYVFKC